jgi:hypothetical protein
MIDLGITDYELKIEQRGTVFAYRLYFTLLATTRQYLTKGEAETPLQCWMHAESYVARIVREAVAA